MAGSVLLVGERILVGVSGGIEESFAVETGGGGASGQTVDEAGPRVVVSKSSDREAGGLGDKIGPADDGGFGAAALAGHLGGADELDAVLRTLLSFDAPSGIPASRPNLSSVGLQEI